MGSVSAGEREKGEVRRFWEATPCGTRGAAAQEGTREYFEWIEAERYEREPFIERFARFDGHRNRCVLEVGVGAGTDSVRFARGGARLTGIDLTRHGVELTRRRLELEGLSADIRVADAESLPFEDDSFDFVYSWGVIHHTPDVARAAREIVRVTRPGGRVCVMLYHRHSLVALQCWALHAALKGRPWRSLSEVIGRHIESEGTRAFSLREARDLFAELEAPSVTPVVTPYDLRLGRGLYLPRLLRRLTPRRLGWFLVVEGRRPAGGTSG